ncbi:MAG: hypothetical protein AEth_00098 [Candidatus Argoarchaeum ethanivorans]|uniref:Uncharacterized protein n=1 Tax=Candidatus Argoarchaeum ethanivorans TaxID=2608793 RepID=A0A8B6SDL5_9EURY|nr:MAG: hypothetical protein AEth_00098 [Candidatus Argoarchaeum ethanivorans]
MKAGNRIALIVIAFFFFIGASVATFVGIIDLINIVVPPKEVITSSNNVIPDLIILAEHFMIAITFFAICIALVYFAVPEPKEKELGKLGEIRDLEKYIFSMVIATVSVIFLSGVLTITTNELNTDEILKVGISIAAVILALGVYTKLTKDGKEMFRKG